MAVSTTAALIAGAAASGGAALLDNKNQKKAIASAEAQKAASQAFIEKQMNQARGDLFKLYPSIQDSNQKGLQAGLDIYRQTVPYQLQAFQQGNVGAQNQILRGLPQAQNAILGRPIDMSGLQAMAIQQPNIPMPQAPQFQGIQAALDPATLKALGVL